jgi:hypothetical protein
MEGATMAQSELLSGVDCESFLLQATANETAMTSTTRRRSRRLSGSGIAVIAVAAAVVITFSSLAAAGGSNAITVPSGVNANGQTYGSDALASSPTNGPDLIAVVATDGLQGYAYQSAINAADGFNVSSPAAAVAWMANGAKRVHYVTVYLQDGTTKIGTFAIGSDQSSQ